MSTRSGSLPHIASENLFFEFIGQWANLVAGPRTLVMQVAHPAVGAAVHDHSTYRDDPFSRLTRTLRSLMTYVYGTPAEAAAEGERLRELHTTIVGSDAQGRRYSGRNPDAVLWVHATFFEPFVTLGDQLLPPHTEADLAAAYEAWKDVGRVLGVPADRIPPTVDDFRAYLEHTIAHVLEDNVSVQEILHWTFTEMRPPVIGGLPRPLWSWWWRPATWVVRQLTVGLLDPRLLERFGERPSPARDRLVDVLTSGARVVNPRTPDALRYMPVAYGAVRRVRRAARTQLRTAA